MKKNFLFIFVLIFLTSCSSSSVQKYNERLRTPVSSDKLRQDVDFVRKNLEAYHPQLYLYISKETLDRKFDSLKFAISEKETPIAFFKQFQPIISEIREGHLKLRYPSPRYTAKEMKYLLNQKGLLARLNYAVRGDSLLVISNKDSLGGILPGSRILTVHNQPVDSLLGRYSTYFSGDGFNTTFRKYVLAGWWPMYFTYDNGILDSVRMRVKDSVKVKEVMLYREKTNKSDKEQQKLEQKKMQKSDSLRIRDYNQAARAFNREFKFINNDSTIAYMKIKSFSGVRSSNFYKNSFLKLARQETPYLIIDIRDNLGGSLSEIKELYSYLAKDTFNFIKPVEITHSKALLKADFLSYFHGVTKIVGILSYPVYYLASSRAKKSENGRFYLKNKNYEQLKPKQDSYRGKLYVLINGSSFSAASILASKIKGDSRGILVGEETGGANDGTVAGRYRTLTLPHSKLVLPIGMMYIQPDISFSHTQRGVVPDKEILPSLKDMISDKDVQLDWVLEEIKKMDKVSH